MFATEREWLLLEGSRRWRVGGVNWNQTRCWLAVPSGWLLWRPFCKCTRSACRPVISEMQLESCTWTVIVARQDNVFVCVLNMQVTTLDIGEPKEVDAESRKPNVTGCRSKRIPKRTASSQCTVY